NSVVEQVLDAELELLCVDDYSTDDTWQKLEALACQFPQVKVFRNEAKGKCGAFSLAFAQSSGDLVLLLAGDDLLPPGALQARIAPWRASETEQGFELVSACKYKTFSTNKLLDGMVMPKLSDKGALSGGTVVFSRNLARRMFPIPVGLISEDLWLRCHFEYLDAVRIVDAPTIGLLYRLHENNSLRRDVDFLTKHQDICRRSVVYGMFLEAYRGVLTAPARDALEKLVALEILRARGCSVSILFFRGVSFLDRARALVYSKAVLYWFHKKLIRLSTGFSR
ncbi:MAG: glycosyltransferase, partial [Congregibacter sp.]|nr:glycosyltransferase [Congregibacter sp.]